MKYICGWNYNNFIINNKTLTIMKRLISQVAAFMLLALLMVSCGGSGTFSSEISALKDAEAKGDVKTVFEKSMAILSGYEKGNSEEIITATFSLINIDEKEFEESGIQISEEENNKMLITIANALTKVKSSDAAAYNKANEDFKKKYPAQESLDKFITIGQAIKDMQ